MCAAEGVELAGLRDRLHWSFTLPTLSDPAATTEFATQPAQLAVDLVVIDPVYLALGPVDPRNMFEAGAAFKAVADVLLRVGCTPLLVHHANRQLASGDPMELHHLAYSGRDQFARQFVLLNRREPYQGDGAHALWVKVGGSFGHGGLWAVDAREGVTAQNFQGRAWTETVQPAEEGRADRAAEREANKRDKQRRKDRQEEADALRAIDGIMEAGKVATSTAIRTAGGISVGRVRGVLTSLIEAGFVEQFDTTAPAGSGGRQQVVGYRRTSRTPGGLFPPSGNGADQEDGLPP